MLRRPRTAYEPPLPAPPLDVEVTDVLRLDCVLDTGLALQFDLHKDQAHTYTHNGKNKWLTITLGSRVIRIAAHRILYTETRPEQLKRVINPNQ